MIRTPPPALHDLATMVDAPALLLGDLDGQLRPGGVSGWYVDDVRLLQRCEVSLVGARLELVRRDTGPAGRHSWSYVTRELAEGADAAVRLERVRHLGPDSWEEDLELRVSGPTALEVTLVVELTVDDTGIFVVRSGGTGDPAALSGDLTWGASTTASLSLTGPGPDERTVDGGSLRCSWTATLEPGSSLRVGLAAQAPGEPLFGPGSDRGWDPVVESDDPRIGRVVRRSLGDLQGLLMRDGDDDFLAAGSPWYLTLFGRDSLWAARLLLPYDDSLALPTLRALARRQGTTTDPSIEEEPGKIPHEIRREELAHLLPPVYYGSVDATALWVCLLADVAPTAPEAEVRALVPALRAALGQVVATSEATGWLRYVDSTGTGLANQGWKDSPDSVSHADGRLADPPIALCEVQAYAYEAAVRGQSLLASLGEAPVPGLDEWAVSLRERFNRDFWTGDGLALALDGEGLPVDIASSDVGHVLGTGILDPDREAVLADLLVSDELSSGFGLRTLTTASPRYAPLSYHNGSVWPHDTAIAVRGLLATGHTRAARVLTAGLLRTAEAFEDRVPELYAGDSAAEVPSPAAYPASCRPQAWSAAGLVFALWGCQGEGDDLLPAYSVRRSSRQS
ncbi:glycogen debranching N-terminal domain-containing protein [Nocardioides marmoribigeumensis]|uniref:Amylo-alpha-1,6-glucosidase n=1 Tax=Nocardioides marmoribigeumensis TaxID=433649 RepID=A0ABU2BZW8_9ACTN|nr:glycogen debranching N-terminal domain-containing protein [Nocardioides marmoribigeumensis]MDR7363931.1 hypothetical protein [Nocardioides marmoribigeumensis]